ncbi:MAG TPA: dihydroorotate dehydrogenase-like protein [Aliidongia sp.]|uniref:dihydroorotate dehydrogenase-like protein n=1 Tax=Aliidongia sp. TaxID=1914230 RepID=UPI002DDD1C8C|nr:dihydroorotate dehydrogenase-like protein [Aliidongia sp.]HEV2675350.1 dihydroorotate dehydrogenase-like protein [Aliidongia sp.]
MSLATHYLGLSLKNPLIASAAPANAQLDHLRRLEDAGAAAVVLPSLFQEQIEADTELEELILGRMAHNSPEASSYLPVAIGPYGVGSEAYLDLIRRAHQALSIPVIASLNGATEAGWTEYARLMEQAGADAIELNIYFVPTDLALTGQQVEDRYAGIVASARRGVAVPLSVKLSPFVSALGNLAQRLHDNGANGLVLFNRLIQPDYDLASMRLTQGVHLSTPAEMPLPLLWTSLLAGRTKLSLAGSTGVHSGDDIVKYLLAGADAVMTASAILRYGPSYMTRMLDELRIWLEVRAFHSVADMRGLLSWARSRHRERYGRPSYIKMLETGPVA